MLHLTVARNKCIAGPEYTSTSPFSNSIKDIWTFTQLFL